MTTMTKQMEDPHPPKNPRNVHQDAVSVRLRYRRDVVVEVLYGCDLLLGAPTRWIVDEPLEDPSRSPWMAVLLP